MSKKLCKNQDCTGCMACKQKCRNDAIKCVEIGGFVYPQIDENKCVNCGQCTLVCPVLNEKGISGNRHENETSCIAAWNINEDIRMKSSSGGTFSAMAEKILDEGGIVFGAAWADELALEHQFVCKKEELDKLRRSKYVQSDTKNTYNEVYDFLKKGRKVMYCGTPCQLAGLTAFLGYKDYDNLVKVDVICQGVPSLKSFKKYISEIEISEKCKVLDANFRSKDKGWRCGLLLLLLHCQNKTTTFIKKMVLMKNCYYNAFIKEYFMRESCYGCKFKNNNYGYYSDITIADFWRIGNKIPIKVEHYEHGINAVVINTKKGREFFKHCSEKLHIVERTWNEFETNGGLRQSRKPSDNDEAYRYLQNHSWSETQRKYFPLTMRRKIKTILFLFLGEKHIRKLYKITGRIK